MKQYTMTDEELVALKTAAATPGVFGGPLAGYDPGRAASEKLWKEMGDRYGFVWETVASSGGDERVFAAKEKCGWVTPK